jgi:hypothetical protein
MRLARLTVVALAALVVAPAAHAAPAPAKLKPFLLRVDEPAGTTFSRTPSFSWSPVRGAKRYEFELATSPKFGEAQLVWTNDTIKSPVATVPVTLPWMSGTPYGFYARVRGLTGKGPTRWSRAYGFNMRWPTVPAALPGQNGLVRWSTVEGATSYQVWYLEAGKIFSTKTNAADQREYWAFHEGAAGVVHWRVRATRVLSGASRNELPAVSYGPWSPVFTSTNTPMQAAPLLPTAMASDVLSSSPAAAHRLTPGFAFSGTNALGGVSYPFYRVVVSTDRECVNVVYRGGIVGGPAFAPRATGPLDLPKNAEELAKADSIFLKDGGEGETFGADYFAVVTNESMKPSSSGTTGNTPTGGTGTSLPAAQTVIGSIVDLWDTGWPSSRYYWTVVPVYYILTDDNKVKWYEAEVPQDVCAAGRVLSFGKLSEPVVTASGAPYVSGLSPDGKLLPAKKAKPSFYGVPVAAWMPALGADQYEVQWSRKVYPWKAEGNVTTVATAAELPLKPGLWYYRVRGLSSTLPTGARQLAWSSPVRIKIAGPRFKVIRGGTR